MPLLKDARCFMFPISGLRSVLKSQLSLWCGESRMTRVAFMKRIDVILVILSIIILFAALWTWVSALQVAIEVVFLATTIALVISLVLIVNIAILVVLRLQKRVSDLEVLVAGANPAQERSDPVVVITLTNTERRIINRLEENNRQMTQDDLRRATGLSKSTLSVTLSTLERKSLIRRIESGRTKIVTLEKKVTR